MFFYLFARRNSRGRWWCQIIPENRVYPSTLDRLRERRYKMVWDSARSEKAARDYFENEVVRNDRI